MMSFGFGSHSHLELILELAELSPRAAVKALRESAAFEGNTWEIGGIFRGIHEPDGPHPDAGVSVREVGGIPFTHTAGLTGLEIIGSGRLARPSDVLALGGAEALAFLERNLQPDAWIRLGAGEPQRIEREQVLELARSDQAAGLALVTIDGD
jgi:hypothetical protein